MSETIDSRVVEMRFDNKQFESNVQTSMSTLEKLKQSLNLTGASKGLENVNAAASKFNLNGMGSAIETVHAKFSALEVMGVTALANITNSAVNAGKRIVSALTIDPVKSGFQEYELKMDSIKTIMASTGESVSTVNKYLEELNEYSDKTIYSFSDMTQNIGKFTNAGVKLEDAVMAIKGISNEAAVSGANANEASRAMYNFAQALSAGYVKLIDWKSIENANMATVEFKQQLIDSAVAVGTLTKTSDGLYQTLEGHTLTATKDFNETLTDQWMTTEVLVNTLKDYADETTDIGKKAFAAAQDVVKLSQMWDVLKETAQSGWAKTWELLFGDIEQAKAIFTPLTQTLSGFIDSMSNARNKLLEGALSSPFAKLAEKIANVTGATEKMAEATKDYGEIVDRVIGGEFGNGQSRWDKLTEAGYDWAKVQNMVNEKLGDSTRYTEQLTEAQNEANKTQALTIEQLIKKSDAQLKSLGFTEDEIDAFRDLEKQSEKTGIPINKLIEDLDQLSGRTLLINSLKNAGSGLVGVFTAMKNAWVEIFPPMTSEQLYNIIAGLHKLSTHLRLTDAETGELTDTAKKLQRTFKGIFAVLGMITDITGGGFKLAFKAVSSILGYFNMDILDVTASIGDALVAFREATNVSKLFDKAIEKVAPMVTKLASGIQRLSKSFMELPIVKQIIQDIQKHLSNLKNMDFKEIGNNIIEGLVNGLDGGAKKVIDAVIELGKNILTSICEVLGIHSPSKEFFDIAVNCVQGFVNGIDYGIRTVVRSIKKLGETIVKIFKSVDWSGVSDGLQGSLTKFKEIVSKIDFKKLLAIIPIGVVLVFCKKLYDVANVLSDGISSINSVISGIAKIESQFANVLKSWSLNIKADALKKIAVAISILVGSVIALTFVDTDKLYSAVVVVFILSGVLAALAFAVSKMSEASVNLSKKQGLKINGLALNIVSIGAALLLLSKAMANFASIDSNGIVKSIAAIITFVVAVSAMVAAFAWCEKNLSIKSISSLNGLLLSISVSLMLMVGVCKLAGKLTPDEMKKGAGFVSAFVIFVGLLVKVTSIGRDKKIAKLSGLLLSISVSLMLMVGVCKLAGTLTPDEMKKGAVFATAFIIFVGILTKIATIGGDKKIAKLGGLLLSISVSLILMVGVCKLVNKLQPEEMVKGAIFVTAFLGLVWAIKKITTIGKDQEMAKVAATILAMSIALGVMAGVAILLSMMPLDGLAKGVGAVSILGLIMAAMIKATQGANNVKGNLIVMTVAIAVMAGAVAALSMIDGVKIASATLALSMLMSMFALMETCAKSATGSIGSLIVMTLAIGALGGILYLLSGLPVESVLGASAGLSILMLSLSTSFAIIGSTSAMAASAMPALVIMVGAVAFLAVILGILSALDAQPSIGTALALSVLLLAMSGVCIILGALGPLSASAIAGAAAFDAVVLVIGGLMVGIGALMTYVPSLEEFLNKGIPVLEKIGYGIGSFVGNVIGGLAAGVTAGLPEIGSNLAAFMESFRGIDPSMLDGVKSLAEAILILTAADILKGIASWLTGGSSLTDFAEQLEPFGEGIKKYANAVSGIGDESVTAIINSAKAAEALVKLADSIPNSGGLLGLLAGNNDIDDFGTKLAPFGEGLVAYAVSVRGLDDTAIQAIQNSAQAARYIVDLADTIPNSGGLLGLLAGNNDIDDFVSQLNRFGEGLVKYAQTVADINLDAITKSTKAVKDIANIDTSAIKNSGSNMIGALEQGIQSKQSSLTSTISNIIDSILKTIASKIPLFTSEGSKAITGFASGVTAKRKDATNSIVVLLDSAVTTIRNYYTSFSNAGGYLGDGLVVGINSRQTAVYNAAYKLGQKAVQGEKDGQKSNSPSKLTIQSGKWFGEGLVIGIKAMGNKVYNAGYNLGDTAVSSVSSSISKVADLINTGIDVEPTIRPVLDLSDVQSGARTISGLFANGASVGVSANLNAISSMMNERNQNGGSDDIVSAINKLRKDIGNIGGTSYTINGITYDDGSGISNAVETLVRAARMERRV